MSAAQAPLILCVASHLKGFHFMREARRLGCRVFLLTHEKLLDQPWPREALENIWALPNFDDPLAVRNTVSYLYRTLKFDRLVPMGDYDVEVTADLREFLRLPGLGVTRSLFFRDKLSMRQAAEAHGVPVPAYCATFHDADVAAYLATTPAPWVLKPRQEAGSKGIQVLHDAHDVWRELAELGDARAAYLLEAFVAGDVFHVDSVVFEDQVVFASAQKYGTPMLALREQGGAYATRTIQRGSAEESALQALNRRVIAALGLPQGVTHIEYLQDRKTGEFFFLEAAARVGAAKISDVIFFATGVCLWHEWAKLEAASPDRPYTPPTPRDEHAGVIIAVARDERPDTTRYTDPEIVWRQNTRPHHAGLLVSSPSAERVAALIGDYERRFLQDFAVHVRV